MGQRYKKNRTPTKDVRFFNSFYLSETNISYLSQIRFEQFTTITLSSSSNSLFLNLTHTLTGQAEFVADFL